MTVLDIFKFPTYLIINTLKRRRSTIRLQWNYYYGCRYTSSSNWTMYQLSM